MQASPDDLEELNTTAGQVARLVPRGSSVAIIGSEIDRLQERLAHRNCETVTLTRAEVCVLDLDSVSLTDVAPALTAGMRVVCHVTNPHHASRTLRSMLDGAEPDPSITPGSSRLDLEERLRGLGGTPIAHARVFLEPFTDYVPGSVSTEVERLLLENAENWVDRYVVAAVLDTDVDPPTSRLGLSHLLTDRPLSPQEARRIARLLRADDLRWAVWQQPQEIAQYCQNLDDEVPVVVLPQAIANDAVILETLSRSYVRHGGPVGLGLRDGRGRVVHAGTDPVGRPVGRGTAATHASLLTADRPGSGLLPPLLAPAGALATGAWPPVGRYCGEISAESSKVPGWIPRQPSRLRDVHERTALVLVTQPPHRMDVSARETVLALLSRLIRSGCTPILSWSDEALANARSSLSDLEREGVVLFGGDGHFDTATRADRSVQFSPGHGLAVAFDVEITVILTAERLAGELGGIVAQHPHAWVVGADLGGRQLADIDALDVQLDDPTDVPARVKDILLRTPPQSPPAIAEITTRPRTSGLTSIVIPVWNMWEMTVRCLSSLRDHTNRRHEIIVVDNGSRDTTPSELARRDVHVITNEENLGFARACNQGLEAARGEYLCVLNNDTEVTAGWLEQLHRALALPGTGMVGPRSNRISGLQVVPDAPGMDNAPAAHEWARRWHRQHRDRSWLITRLVGFCLLAPGSVFEEVGGFDAGVGLGNFEDDELCARVLGAGYTLRVADGSVVLHHGSATFTAAGLDYGATMATGARHTGDRLFRGSTLTTAVVLSDDEAIPAIETIQSARAVADHAVLIERGDLLLAEIVGGLLGPRVAAVESTDWRAVPPRDLIQERKLSRLLMRAGESVSVDDWGAARAEIEQYKDVGALVEVDGDPEPRLLGAGGGKGTVSLRHLNITGGR